MAYKPDAEAIERIAGEVRALAEKAGRRGICLEDFCGGVAIALNSVLEANVPKGNPRYADALRLAIGAKFTGGHGGDLGVFRGNNKRFH